MAEIKSFKVGACWVHRCPDHCTVVEFPDGQRIIARPNGDEASEHRAFALGYRGNHAERDMTMEHDPAHLIVATILWGIAWSPVLRWAATGVDVSSEAHQLIIAKEEAEVLQLQSDLNAGRETAYTRTFLSVYKGRLT